MLLDRSRDFNAALEWLVAHRRDRMEVYLTQRGLSICGPAIYELTDQSEGALGIVLNSLQFWIVEAEVESVWVDPEDDALLLIADELRLYLQPQP